MDQGLQNAAYLLVFMEPDWWGWSSDPANPELAPEGNFLRLIRNGASLGPALLLDADAALDKDLAQLVTIGAAKSVKASSSIIGLGLMGVEVDIVEPDGTPSVIKWKLNWAAMAEEAAL